MKRRDIICAAVLSTIAVIVLIIGFVILGILPSIVQKLVNEQVALKNGSFTEETWERPPFKIGFQIWIYNVTNAKDVLANGAKPHLVEKGPYGFREQQAKYNLDYSKDEKTISYLNQRVYNWDPSTSCQGCVEMDAFTVPNIPYLTILKIIRDKTPGFNIPARLAQFMLTLMGEQPFAFDITARQLLFEGYPDRIFDLINVIKPGAVPERMGLFFGKNLSSDGLYQIHSGIDDPSRVGQILQWKNHTNLTWTGWWRKEYPQSSMINGSDGSLYAPFIRKGDSLPIFVSDICRSVHITYDSNRDYDGLPAMRFTVPEEVFDASSPANQGFCWPSLELYYPLQQPWDPIGQGWCLPSGMLDISKCQNGAPIVVSSPHFLFCPDAVIDSVDGLPRPDLQTDNTYLDLEPTTGVVLSGSRKLQLNVAMYNDAGNPNYKSFNRMKSAIIPLIWINESVTIDDKTRKYVYDNVVVQQRSAHIGLGVAIALGLVLIGIVVAFVAYRCVQDKRNREADGRWDVVPSSEQTSTGSE